MSADPDRRARLKRIRALLDKTVARGCTEAEAIEAARVAARLMAEYNIDAAEVGAGEKRVRVAPPPFWHGVLIDAVCRCTNTVSVRDTAGGTLSFIGREPGPVVAAYLRDVSIRAVLHARSGFIRSPGYFRHRLHLFRDRAEEAFLRGCSERLAERLIAVFPPPDAGAIGQAVALRAHLYPCLAPIAAAGGGRLDGAALLAGQSAADAVGLHRGVAGGRADHRRIGGLRA